MEDFKKTFRVMECKQLILCKLSNHKIKFGGFINERTDFKSIRGELP